MKIALKILLPLLLVAILLVVLLRSAKPEAIVEPVRRDLAVDAVSGNLRIFSTKNLVVKTELGGRVVETIGLPNSGPIPVKAGETIMQLDTSEIQRALDLAKVKLESARRRRESGSMQDAAITNAEADLKLQEELAANNQFPTADLEKTRRQVQSLRLERDLGVISLDEQISVLETNLKGLEADLKKLTVVSPFDGIITEMLTLPGDIVYGGAAVARVISNENVVEVSLSEEDFSGIQLGQTVTARLLAQGSSLYDGKVSVVLAEADPESRRRSVFVELDAPDYVLVPGTTGQASITKSQREDALVIPRRALLGSSVYVVQGGVARLKEVTTGFLGLNLAEITSGLKEGDSVIVETPHLFRDGESVEPVEAGN